MAVAADAVVLDMAADQSDRGSERDSSDAFDDAEATHAGDAAPPEIPRRRFRPMAPRPNCTHIVMDYYYTTRVPCDNCGNPPRLGWLYVCQQDHYSEAIARRQIETLREGNDKEQLPSRIAELKACGMSRSILDQVKQGNVYDPFQIEVCAEQVSRSLSCLQI
jgi:hypothetical protein